MLEYKVSLGDLIISSDYYMVLFLEQKDGL